MSQAEEVAVGTGPWARQRNGIGSMVSGSGGGKSGASLEREVLPVSWAHKALSSDNQVGVRTGPGARGL